MVYRILLLLLILILILILPFQSKAKTDCFITEAMNDPTLINNKRFWEEFSSLMDHGEVSEKTYRNLVLKFKTVAPGSESPMSAESTIRRVSSSTTIQTSRKADKDLAKLPNELLSKYEEFVAMAMSEDGVREFYKNPGRWHIEKLKGVNSFTVRLNKGVRVEFFMEKDKLYVLQVNADHVHDHLKK